MVYQLLDSNDKVVYYGITSRTANERLAEHLVDPEKIGKFTKMQVIAENLSHDQARTLEAIKIRDRLDKMKSKYNAFDYIKKQLDKSGLLNKNRGRDIDIVGRKYTGDIPELDSPREVNCG